MKISIFMLRSAFLLATCSCFIAGCVRNREGPSNLPSTTCAKDQMTAPEFENQPIRNEKDRAALRAALGRAAKAYEERLNGKPPPPSEFPFPNFETGPGHPLPSYVNFYRINNHFPTYLLCGYDVEEKRYDETNEPRWFRAALEQIRRSGPQKFPPIEWVAIIIFDREEAKHVKTWDHCYRIGAIFKASEVFDSSQDLSQLVARAEMDRHPFMLDPQQPTPGEQQRWMIVERHAVTDHPISK